MMKKIMLYSATLSYVRAYTGIVLLFLHAIQIISELDILLGDTQCEITGLIFFFHNFFNNLYLIIVFTKELQENLYENELQCKFLLKYFASLPACTWLEKENIIRIVACFFLMPVSNKTLYILQLL